MRQMLTLGLAVSLALTAPLAAQDRFGRDAARGGSGVASPSRSGGSGSSLSRDSERRSSGGTRSMSPRDRGDGDDRRGDARRSLPGQEFRRTAPPTLGIAPPDAPEPPGTIPRQVTRQPPPLDERGASGERGGRDFLGRPLVTCQTGQGYCRFVYRRFVEPGLPCRCGDIDGETR